MSKMNDLDMAIQEMAATLRQLDDALTARFSDKPNPPVYYNYAVPYIRQAVLDRWRPAAFVSTLYYIRLNISGWRGDQAALYKREIDNFLHEWGKWF